MKKGALWAISIWFLMFVISFRVSAEELTPEKVSNAAERTVAITAKEGEKIGALYIKWNNPVVPYQIKTDSAVTDCGSYGFLHEFIPLPEQSEQVTILLPEEKMEIYDLRIFTDENVPEDVQIWQPPHERADIMLVSAHSDDEILFMGGIVPVYGAEAGARVQVVYMTEFWSTAPVREHEKLDGLWVDGLKNYPVCGGFKDIYAKDMEQAKKLYDEQAMTDYLTDMIRCFQPQVTVTHDFKGEYGHGFHQLTAKAMAQALENAADDNCRTDTESYREKGSWEVPKAYFHLYPEHTLHMELNEPLASMGGQTALEAAKAAYLQHVSQQWCWFYVSDTYEYSCADFGLYRSLVGFDTENNMLENIVLYEAQEEQERLEKEEQERLAREEQERFVREEQERLAREEQERFVREEQERLAREEQERLRQEELRIQQEEAARLEQERQRKFQLSLLAGGIIALAVLTACLIGRTARRRKLRNS